MIKRIVIVGVILLALGIGAGAYYMRRGEAKPPTSPAATSSRP